MKAYWDKVELVKQSDPNLKLYFVTLTVKDGESLQERFNHLVKAERSYKRQRRNALAGQRFVEYAKAQGAFVPLSSNEVKTLVFGIHMHMIWLCSEAPDAHQLSKGMGSLNR